MRLWLRDAGRKPDPQAARADGLKAVIVGTAVWLLAALGAAIYWPLLVASDTEWMLGCAVTGVVLGGVSGVIVRLRRRS